MGEREKGHEWKFLYKFDGLIFSKCECGEPKGTMWTDKKQHAAHLASLEAHPRTYKCVKCCDTGMFAGLPCQFCSADHPSAGQSDESLRDIDPTVILHAAGLKQLYDKLVESRKESAELRKELIAANEQIEGFDARLAESRAAMREEAAEVAEKALRPEQDAKREELLRHFIVVAIRSLPADSSALDARDARVRLEVIEQVEAMGGVSIDPDLAGQIGQWLRAQRSAEKGKGE